MKKPIIGILGAQCALQTAAGPVKTAYVNDAYCQAVLQAGGVPVLLPVTASSDDNACLFALCDGLLFPGGEDVDPRFYHEVPHRLLGSVNQVADAFWFSAFEYAGVHHLPVLGICRGMQLINVAMGGSLYQDLSERAQVSHLHLQNQNRDYLMHKVQLVEGSRLEQILGGQELYTNTMHHQCVHRLGEGLISCASTMDGVVEALESADGSVMLVQWHPEELLQSEPRMRNLFADLIKRASHK